MTKEDLIAMGLTEEQAKKVMESLDGNFVTKTRFNEVNEENKTLKKSVSDRDKHQDYMDKYCPHRTLDMGWDRFKKMVQKELDALKKPTVSVSKELKDKVQKRFGFSDGTIAFLMKHSNPETLFKKLATQK